ncbi:MAG: cation transporter [Clostridiales bacterium]|nr:cation transporter [Clostridiales bacterium]
MNRWLLKRLIGDSEDRGRIGQAGSAVGIVVNALLAVMKFIVGSLTGSVAVAADAVNNLSDAGGSVVSLVTMRMAQKPVDKEHPFGHGRMEYIGALGVGALILLMGFELLKDSVSSILHPALLAFSWVPFIILVVSILMKIWLYLFYRDVGKQIDSAALLAASKDSLSDVIATSAVAVSMLAGHFFGWPVDGWMGLVVALLIFKAGFDVCKGTIDQLLGGEPDKELGRKICDMVLAYEHVLGVHDLMVHDYGPGRCMASLHAEVPADGNLIELHEIIDRAEQEIAEKLNIIVCIHMDPIVTGDEETDRAHAHLSAFLEKEGLMLHDLRRVPGKEQINLVFDVALPVDYKDTEGLCCRISEAAKELDPRHVCVIHFDMDFYHRANG